MSLPESESQEAGRFGLHPALLDAAMHAAILNDSNASDDGGMDIRVADVTGAPVLTVGSMVSRPVDAGQLGTASAESGALYGTEWVSVAAGVAGVPVWAEWSEVAEPGGVVPGVVALVAPVGGAGDVVQAPVWGALRAASAENPGRFAVVGGVAVVEDGRVHGGVQVRVVVGPRDADRRTVAVYSRPEGTEQDWTIHASGFLAEGVVAAGFELAQWPPVGAEVLPVEDAYEVFGERGYGYGPVFQGLKAAWVRGWTVCLVWCRVWWC
ncbi:polyketide synthase dehydratase domain-containing protein [Streptomyces tardus]|uniref:polyketide synthase dehydratase domain-containing protein n=1 Tax=Streptomyces tardus TaxID=2780544 RepID=UPI0035576FBF